MNSSWLFGIWLACECNRFSILSAFFPAATDEKKYNLNPKVPHANPFRIWLGLMIVLTARANNVSSNHTRMSTIQPRRPEKKTKKHVTFTRQFTLTSCATIRLHFIQSNPKILKAFQTTFPTKWSLATPKVGEKSPSQNQDCWGTFMPKSCL